MLETLFPPKRRAAIDVWDVESSEGWTPYLSARRTRAGVAVNEDIALTYSAVWCCTRILCETAASLPLFLYRRLAKDGREHATDHSLYDILHSAPNPDMGSMAFREGRTMHQVNWGNGFAEIERADPADPESRVVALWPIHPSRVRATRKGEADADGNPLLPAYPYLVRNDDGSYVAMRASEILHIPGVLSEDGIWGKGVVTHARETIGAGLAMDRKASSQHGDGNLPRVVLFLSGMKDREQRKNFREEWAELHGNPDSHIPGILPTDSKLDKLNFSDRDSQFLESRVHSQRTIATWYRVPPHMIGDLERATFSNIEHLGIEFVVYSLMPWLKRWEEQIRLKLLTPAEREEYFVEHQVAGLLRGDLQTRMAAYQVALMNGIMTINEVRALENLNNIGPAGDKHFVPLNMTTAEAAEEAMQELAAARQAAEEREAAVAAAASAPELVQIGLAVVNEELPADGARAMIEGSFPLMEPAIVDAMITALEDFEPKPKPAPPLPFGGPPAGPPTEEPVEPEEGPEGEEAEPPAEPDGPPAREAMAAAARAVLVDVLGRMLTKEANAASRKLTSGDGLAAWLAEWYGKHEATLAEALGPACQVVSCAGISADPLTIAATMAAESRAEVAGLAGLPKDEWGGRLAGWPTARAQRVAEAILSGEYRNGS